MTEHECHRPNYEYFWLEVDGGCQINASYG